MKVIGKILLWVMLLGLASVFAIAVYFGTVEAYIYFTRSEAKAQATAQTIFQKICRDERLDPQSFHGPDRPSIAQDQKRDQYTFVWNRGQNESVYVNVSYLPYDTASSVSEEIIERRSSPSR